MSIIAKKLKPLLIKEEIEFREEGNSLFVILPNKFGELEITDLEDGDDIIELVGEQWHIHSNCFRGEHLGPHEKILHFLKDINEGRYFLIEEQEPEKEPVRTIENNLEYYRNNLPEGTTYKVFNEK